MKEERRKMSELKIDIGAGGVKILIDKEKLAWKMVWPSGLSESGSYWVLRDAYSDLKELEIFDWRGNSIAWWRDGEWDTISISEVNPEFVEFGEDYEKGVDLLSGAWCQWEWEKTLDDELGEIQERKISEWDYELRSNSLLENIRKCHVEEAE